MDGSFTIVLARVLLLTLIDLFQLLQIEVLLTSLSDASCYFNLTVLFINNLRTHFIYLILCCHLGCMLTSSIKITIFQPRTLGFASFCFLEVSILAEVIIIGLAYLSGTILRPRL